MIEMALLTVENLTSSNNPENNLTFAEIQKKQSGSID
jgi:hypothetical protein